MFYHITRKDNVPDILLQGLIPQIGDNCFLVDEDCNFSNPPENAKILHFDNKPRKGFCIISLEPVRTPGWPIEHVLIKDPRGFTVYVPSADILNQLLQTDIVNQTI